MEGFVVVGACDLPVRRFGWHGRRLAVLAVGGAIAALPEALARGADEQIAFQAQLVLQLLGVIVAAIAVAAAFSVLGLAFVRLVTRPWMGHASTFVAWAFLRAPRVLAPLPVRVWRTVSEAVDAGTGPVIARPLLQVPSGITVAAAASLGLWVVLDRIDVLGLAVRNGLAAVALHGALVGLAGLPGRWPRVVPLAVALAAGVVALGLAGRHPLVQPWFDALAAAVTVLGLAGLAAWRAGGGTGLAERLRRLGWFVLPLGAVAAAIGFGWRAGAGPPGPVAASVALASAGTAAALVGLYLALQGQPKVSLPVFVSIVGVAAGVWALIVVLSVMGGFATDLRQKMLVANAHALIERPGRTGGFDGAVALTEALGRLPEVAAVSPQVRGDAILSSAFNVNNFVSVRGIDPTLPNVARELGATLVSGDLLLLAEPHHLAPDRARVRRPADTPTDLPPTPQEPPHAVVPPGRGELEALLRLAPGPATAPLPNPASVLPSPLDDDLAPGAGVEAIDAPIAPGIVLGVELARSLQAELGDRVEVVTPDADVGPTGLRPRVRTFRVAGTFETGLYEADSKVAYIAIAEAARYFNLDGQANTIELRLHRPAEPEAAVLAIGATLRRAGAPTDLEVLDWRQLNRSLFSALAFERLVIFLVLGLIILVAAFSIVSALTMVILQKHDGIAMLRAMGSPAGEVRAAFVQMGGAIGAIGTCAGATLGVGTCLLIRTLGIQLPEAYYVRTLPVHLQPTELAAVMLAAVLVSLAATVVPATSAARLAPLEGLRHG
ncbi:MAG: ABC transporter permease [Myxococcales bacterium]|nr:ABC transporter permease [Myxococcales bacterium]